VITDGFYEWTGLKNARQPHWFHRPDHGLIVMAGLWKWQRNAEGTVSQVFIILTARANALMAPIHDRMPVMLDESRFDEWTDPGNADSASLRALFAPAPEDWLIAEPASPLVNSVKNDGPERGPLLG
jgi:putative SOS response-associated peptidase YedK